MILLYSCIPHAAASAEPLLLNLPSRSRSKETATSSASSSSRQTRTGRGGFVTPRIHVHKALTTMDSEMMSDLVAKGWARPPGMA